MPHPRAASLGPGSTLIRHLWPTARRLLVVVVVVAVLLLLLLLLSFRPVV